MSADLVVQRYEEKYLLEPIAAARVRGLMDALLQRDGFSARGAYYIRSLYFDTPDDRDYEDKLLGVSERTKLRLRLYDTAAETVKLEIKAKSGTTSHKQSAALPRALASALAAGRADGLLDVGTPAARAAYAMLRGEARRPAVLIDYERTAWVLPTGRTRITLDEHVRAAKSAALFDPAVPMAGVHSGQAVILEIKYDTPLPPFLRSVLSSVQGTAMSVSKYATARALLY